MLKEVISFLGSTFLGALKIIRSPKEGIRSLFGVSLYRNAIYLMMNSAINAGGGFVFWLVATRSYSPEDVGLGSALISAVRLLSFIGTLGLGLGIIRFLSSSPNKARLLNSSFTICLLVSIVAAVIFLAGLPVWSPKLMFLRENFIFPAAFIVFAAVGALDTNLIQTFIGFRRANFAMVNSLIFSIRIILVIAFIFFIQGFGILAAYGVAQTVALIICLFLFLPRVLPGYFPLPSFQREATNEMFRFTFANFVGEISQYLPVWILPLMVVNMISAEANAYFYVTWTVAGLLMAIPMTTSLSFFAEGSHEEGRTGADLRKSLRMVILLLVPAIIIVCLLGDKLLLLFGREYSTAGIQLLWLLAPAAIPASINLLYVGTSRVEKRLKEIIFITGTTALGTLILSYLLLPRLGILGVGVGWLASQSLVMLILLPRFIRKLKQE